MRIRGCGNSGKRAEDVEAEMRTSGERETYQCGYQSLVFGMCEHVDTGPIIQLPLSFLPFSWRCCGGYSNNCKYE